MNVPASATNDSVVLDQTDTDFAPPDDTSEASPIFGGLMVFWFAAFGIGAAYFAVTAYLEGTSLTNPRVLFPLGGTLVMSLAAGVVAQKVTWRSSSLPENAPWELRPAWQSPTIEEALYFRTVPPSFAVAFTIAGWGAGGLGYWIPEDPSISSLFLLIFPVVFSIPAVLSLRRAWHRRTYGTSTLTMNTMPGRLGRPLDAHVQAGVNPEAMQDDKFEVTLTCYRRHKSGENTSWHPLWEAKKNVQEHASPSAETPPSPDKSIQIPVSFDLPTGAPPSTPEKKSERIAWVLEVSTDMKGLDYQSYFEIPIFKPEETTNPTSEQPSTSSPIDAPAQDPPSADPSPADEPASSPESVTPKETLSTDNPSAPRETDPSPPESSTSSDESVTDRYDDAAKKQTDQKAGEETIRCDNCYSAVDASASTCPACGADLESGWFS